MCARTEQSGKVPFSRKRQRTISHICVSFQELIKRASDIGDIDTLVDALSSFRCCKNTDIEIFLRNKAFQYIEREWCSIYLILNRECFVSGEVKIEAYFTLSHKSLIPEKASKSKVNDVAGFKYAESVHFVLIGQLGKHIEKFEDGSLVSSNISSVEILDYAFEIIRASSSLIPCRCVLVECGDEEKVHNIYTSYGFKKFQYDGEHYQFYKRI